MFDINIYYCISVFSNLIVLCRRYYNVCRMSFLGKNSDIAVAFYSNNKIVLIATYIQIYIAVTISNITRIIAPQYNLQL